jgi:hypothetical protein
MLFDPVDITLDKKRTLRLTLKGMLEFNRITGKNLLKGFDFKAMRNDLEQSAAFMYACLIHEDKELTYDDVLCMIDIGNISEMSDAVIKCINQSVALKAEREKRPLAKKP